MHWFYIYKYKKQKHFLGKTLVPPIQVTGSTDMYITLNGIGKILYVSVLRNLLICIFLNFMAVFSKKIKLNFAESAYNFPCEKINLSLIDATHITILCF